MLSETAVERTPSASRKALVQRVLQQGATSLADSELLDLVMSRGRGNTDQWILRAGGLKGLLGRGPQELRGLPGLGSLRASQLLAALELGRRAQRTHDERPRLKTPAEIFLYLQPFLGGLRREVFHVLCLNTRNTLLADVRVAEGTVDSCPVDPREVFAPALSVRASAVVLVHNHPSGDPDPSGADLTLTAQLVEGGRLLGIRVLDHLILGDSRWLSLLQRGQMPLAFNTPRSQPWHI